MHYSRKKRQISFEQEIYLDSGEILSEIGIDDVIEHFGQFEFLRVIGADACKSYFDLDDVDSDET